MKQLLLSDKIPYLFTFLFGLGAYQINNIVNYISDSPVLTYDYTVLSYIDSNNVITEELELEISNLNRNKGFEDLTIYTKYSTDITITPAMVYDPVLIPIAPATILPDSLVENRHKLINSYHIPRLQPMGKYILRLKITRNKKIKEYPRVYFKSKDDIWLTDSTAETLIVKYRFSINIILLIVWLVLILLYFIFLIRQKLTYYEI